MNTNPFCLWFTGLSGAGKTTLAVALEKILAEKCSVCRLDGDILRTGLCSDLGFSDDDRNENLRRAAEVARLFLDKHFVVLAAFISPLQKERENIRAILKDYAFFEVFVDSSLDTCIKRDVKGLYKKAMAGLIPHFTGIDSIYEQPVSPEIHLDTANSSVEDCVNSLLSHLKEKALI